MLCEVASPGIEQDSAIETMSTDVRSASELQTDAALRYRVGNRCWSYDDAAIACEPQRNVAGPRITSI